MFEVGCGAGGYLYCLAGSSYRVAGLDPSVTLIGHAREAMPGANLIWADALDLDVSEPYDAVISWGVFHYFPSHQYARQIIEMMARKARHVMAVIDLPDVARKDADIALRKQTLGGEAAYGRRYDGLEHLYYDRAWVAETLASCGLTDVRVDGQWTPGYANAAFRFNAWGFKPRT